MDEVQITLLEHRELAEAEQVVSHMQVEVEYFKKILWSNETALKKEKENLKKIQTKYHEHYKNLGRERI